MTDKFRNQYRIPSARASWWDYGADAAYFVTICTKDRIRYFGKVEDGVVDLSDIGKIAYKCWEATPNHFPFVILDEFVIMPNHVHGIIVINKGQDVIVDDNPVLKTLHATSPRHATPLPNNRSISKISPKLQSSSSRLALARRCCGQACV